MNALRARLASLLLAALAMGSTACDDIGDDIPHYDMPYKAEEGKLKVYDGSNYRPIFSKGFNLGIGLPGHQAGELAATREQYQNWFKRMGELGVNTLRIYTLHYPRFFEELDAYNRAHMDKPLYVMHGIWLDEEDPTNDLYDMAPHYDENLIESTDCVHGNNVIGERMGRAFGTYDHDISPWVIGWVIGREVFPDEISTTNARHPEKTSYQGQYVSLPHGTPSEVWWTERMDKLAAYEWAKYGVKRPLSVSSWPTLDPLHHPTEGKEEDGEYLDFAQLDMSKFAPGYFATYHAYPYYPNFVSEDLNYTPFKDDVGPNSYLGYITTLKDHYYPMPLVIGEVGVPSSWGNAHYAHSGMSHGGQDEVQQGLDDARLLRNVYESGCAGAELFAWVDEWWKRTWIVDELAMPRADYKLWHNVTSPEQNFGVVGFALPDPDFTKNTYVNVSGGRVTSIQAVGDAAFFHVRVNLRSPFGATETMTLGFDTYADDRGESVLPDRVVTKNRNEFAMQINGTTSAKLYVTDAYDQFGVWHARLTSGIGTDASRTYHSTRTDGGPWNFLQWKNDGEHGSVDGKYNFPMTIQPIGNLRIRAKSAPASSADSVVIDGSVLELRIPWTLLNVADPTTHTVIDDDKATRDREVVVSAGIAVSISLNGELVETPRFEWPEWNECPAFTEYEKPSLEIVGQQMRALPYWLDGK